ncbi:MAG: hypothetical protein QM675_06465 [Protaetiibacter sp.]
MADSPLEQALPELAALVADAVSRLAPGGGPMPEPAPADPALRAGWLEQVALIRARHDSSALEAGVLLDELLRDALGDDPLGIGDTPVEVQWGHAAPAVGLRVYRPASDRELPVVALVHGGAYWMGGGAAGWRLNDALCRRLATGCPPWSSASTTGSRRNIRIRHRSTTW